VKREGLGGERVFTKDDVLGIEPTHTEDRDEELRSCLPVNRRVSVFASLSYGVLPSLQSGPLPTAYRLSQHQQGEGGKTQKTEKTEERVRLAAGQPACTKRDDSIEE